MNHQPVNGADVGRVTSPYARSNLRCNPFGEPSPEDLPGLIVANTRELALWLTQPRRALQFVGHCGRGKTAHLRALNKEWDPHAPYVYLAEDEPLPPLPASGRLLLDECQRLPRRRRRALFRRLDSLVVATHSDHERELVAAGWQVRTIEIAGVNLETFTEIINRRLEWARLRSGPLPRLSKHCLQHLHERHGDDLRSALEELYETYQVRIARGRWPGRSQAIVSPPSPS